MSSTAQSGSFAPDFVVLGARRCGTTWLYEVLLSCPSIALSAVVKESHFFYDSFERGIEWYRSLFGDLSGKTLIGEVDPNLLNYSHQAAPHIHQVNPHAKLIAIFRDPAKLYYSSYLYAIKEGEVTGTAEEVWDTQPHFRREVSYFDRIKPFLDRFPREQFLFLRHEDLRADAVGTLTRIFAFLGVESVYDDALLDKQVNVSRASRAPWITHPITRVVHFLRRHGLHRTVAFGKQIGLSRVLEALMEQRSASEISPDLRARVLGDLQEDLGAFERELGLAWR